VAGTAKEVIFAKEKVGWKEGDLATDKLWTSGSDWAPEI